MDVYIVSTVVKPAVREIPSILNHYKPFRNVYEGTALVTDYMEIGGIYVTGVDIHDDDIYVKDTIVFVIGGFGGIRDTVVEARIAEMVRAIADYRKGLLTEVTWLSEEMNSCKIEIDGRYKYEGEDYDSLEAAYAVRIEKLNTIAG